MKACKVFPSQNDTATLVCPHCGLYKDVNVAKFKNRVGPLKVRCTCRSTFAVDRRTAFRKHIYLLGYCSRLPECKEWSRILIEDISPNGIGFTTVTPHNFREGDKLRLKFTLDDTKRSEVTKTAIVKWTAKANRVGCEFCEPTHFDKPDMALAFYLMF